MAEPSLHSGVNPGEVLASERAASPARLSFAAKPLPATLRPPPPLPSPAATPQHPIFQEKRKKKKKKKPPNLLTVL
jgi:hypothetical protein